MFHIAGRGIFISDLKSIRFSHIKPNKNMFHMNFFKSIVEESIMKYDKIQFIANVSFEMN